MPPVYRFWISPYGDEDFEWDRGKSLKTFADRDLVFEAARIVFRGPLLRRLRFMVLGELYGRVVMINYNPRRGKCRIMSLRAANAAERAIYYEHTSN